MLTFFPTTTFGQREKVGSLIEKINNTQVIVAMQYVWYPVMKSESGDSLISIGKSATKDLVTVLNDTSKGIIAHFILTSIWADDLINEGRKVGSGVSYIPKDSVNRIYYTGLTFYQDNDFRIFAKQDELDRNKNEWLAFIASKSKR